ncbi:hypothetical protein CYQ88_04795 [Hydrogenovibrio sp. SC-1]|uniref:bifunctional diguanylate cyclase/phosphodiesterase n=1 Tax=Hydrogenovibrio sp. SC-1 TaxID=2065820 RepID=UPI000C7CD6A3|nr:diguanylate cyclase [Hydrogenovibrio sp. SC-1]PLA74632.1 hypothetical protein CYQ88_04795 [Hydrogenovibrio sp. SC-1]
MTSQRLYFRILAFAIPLILILISFHLMDKKLVRDHWQQNMQFSAIQMKDKLTSEVEGVIADVLAIAKDSAQIELVAEGNLQSLQSRFIALSQHKNRYAQVRYIDESGQERVRVDHQNGAPVVIESDQLQDKSNRYYFQQSHQMPSGGLYVSPLDLNVEQGQIERPLKPMIRFASPVVDVAGHHLGIIIINYRIGDVLKLFEVPHPESDGGNLLLLNSKGYWLAGGDPDKRWGNMFGHRHSFAEERPNSWGYISALLDQKQFVWQADGYFYAATIYREADYILSLANEMDTSLVKTDDPWFAVVSETTPEEMFAGAYQRLLIAGVLVAILIVVRGAAMNYLRKIKNKKHVALAHAKRMTQIVEQTSDFVFITDLDGKIEYVNPAFCDVTGYDKHKILSKQPSILKSGRHPHKYYENLWNTIKTGGTFRGMMINRRSDDSLFYEEKTITPLINDAGRLEGFVSIGKDVTQSEITKNAFHDPLTGLVSRSLFEDRLAHEIEQSQRLGTHLALLYLDLDGFKQVNDTLGHQAGDDILIAFSEFCLSVVRKSDTVSRLGGDEFAILMTGFNQSSDVEALATKLIENIQDSYWCPDNCSGTLGVSIGINLYSAEQSDIDPKQFMAQADQAMYVAKNAGKNQYALYTESNI